MTKKQEKIKEAYGQYWEDFKSYVDHNGRLKVLWTSIFYGITDEFKKLKELIEIADIEWDGEIYSIPRSLVGISDNNGWISIESESDLPKNKLDHSFVYSLKENMISSIQLNIVRNDQIEELFDDDWITHYQHIVKPKPPIY